MQRRIAAQGSQETDLHSREPDRLPDREPQDRFRDRADSVRCPDLTEPDLHRADSARCPDLTEQDPSRDRADSVRCRVLTEQDLSPDRADSSVPQALPTEDLHSPDSVLQAVLTEDLFRDSPDSAPQAALTEQDLTETDRTDVPLPDPYRTADPLPRDQNLFQTIQMNLSSASLTGKVRTKNNLDLLYLPPLL